MSNFFFCHNVFKSCLLQRREKAFLMGKDYHIFMHLHQMTFATMFSSLFNNFLFTTDIFHSFTCYRFAMYKGRGTHVLPANKSLW